MPTQPATPAIMTAIQGIIQGLIVSGGSSAFFASANVEIGTFKDVTQQLPACEITMLEDESGRLTLGNGAAMGGKIKDIQLFQVEVTLDMTDSVAVEQNLALIRDALSSAFHASASLALLGVQYSGWQDQRGRILKGQAGYRQRNGVWYRVYRRNLFVEYEYSVTIVP